jgi:hypothetical protein
MGQGRQGFGVWGRTVGLPDRLSLYADTEHGMIGIQRYPCASNLEMSTLWADKSSFRGRQLAQIILQKGVSVFRAFGTRLKCSNNALIV